MKKSKVIIISAITGLVVLGTSAGVAYSRTDHRVVAQATENDITAPSAADTTSQTTIGQKVMEQVMNASFTDATETLKEETVYVIADAQGTVNKIIVSDWLKNPDSLKELVDTSTLSNITNVKGEETFIQGENNSLTWNAAGRDIYYQGESKEELPVKLHVTYALDGTEITPEELVGKSGNVTITFQYEETKDIPFLVVLGMKLNNDKFRNIEVINGKVVNDGSKTFVVGAAMPGVKESLSLTDESMKTPTEIVLNADVTDYESFTTMSLVTNELFHHLDVSSLSDMSNIKEKMGELSSKVSQLVDGTSELYNGMLQLQEQTSALPTGILSLATGYESLSAGIGTVFDAVKTLDAGADNLSDGLSKLTSQNDTLIDGSTQVFTTLLASTQSQLIAAGLTVPDLTIDNYEKTLSDMIQQLSQSKEPTVAYAAESVKVALTSLKTYQTFYDGLGQYTQGVLKASQGSQKLAAGTEQLFKGIGSLNAGEKQVTAGFDRLQSSCEDLIAGIDTLTEGSKIIADGVALFDEVGVEAIRNLVDADLSEFVDNVTNMIHRSKAYESFSGISDGMTGSVRFIIKTE